MSVVGPDRTDVTNLDPVAAHAATSDPTALVGCALQPAGAFAPNEKRAPELRTTQSPRTPDLLKLAIRGNCSATSSSVETVPIAQFSALVVLNKLDYRGHWCARLRLVPTTLPVLIEDEPTGSETMLILTRRVGETVMIGNDITVTVLGVKGGQVRIGTTAPKEVSVHRQEIHERIQRDAVAGSRSAPRFSARPCGRG